MRELSSHCIHRRDSGVMVDTDTGVLYMDVPDANEGRSLKAVGTAVAGGIASGVAGAVGNAVLNNKYVTRPHIISFDL